MGKTIEPEWIRNLEAKRNDAAAKILRFKKENSPCGA